MRLHLKFILLLASELPALQEGELTQFLPLWIETAGRLLVRHHVTWDTFCIASLHPRTGEFAFRCVDWFRNATPAASSLEVGFSNGVISQCRPDWHGVNCPVSVVCWTESIPRELRHVGRSQTRV